MKQMKFSKISIAIIYLFFIGFRLISNAIEFSADIKVDGLEGIVLFINRNDKNPVHIKTNLNGNLIPETGLRWEIREKPTLHYYGSDKGYCDQLVAQSQLLYDLTESHDFLRSRGVYVNEKLVVDYTDKSILGHSLVIKNGNNAIACATILPANQKHEKVDVYHAKFNQMLGGEIYFIKVNVSTLVLGYTYGIDENLMDIPMNWQLIYMSDSKVVGSNGLHNYDETNYTKSCTHNNSSNCYIGEMGTISADLIGKKADQGWSSMYHIRHVFHYMDIPKLAVDKIAIKLIPKIVNNSIEVSYPIFPLSKVEQTNFKSILFDDNKGLAISDNSIQVHFYQPSPYHTTILEAKIDINSHYLKDNSKLPLFSIYNTESSSGHCNYAADDINSINSYPPIAILGTSNYEILPPFKNFTDSMLHLEYPVQVSLFGTRSILESILLINFSSSNATSFGSSDMKNVICGPIRPINAEGMLHLSASFKNETGIYGSVDMIQYIFSSSKSEPIIWINLKNEDGNKTTKHMIHIHEYAPDPSTNDPSWRCSVTAGHFNPLAVTKDGDYDTLCGENTIYRCEIGDISGKFYPYNIGYGEMKIVDPNLDLHGKYSPNGRSLVVHGPEGEKDYVACESLTMVP